MPTVQRSRKNQKSKMAAQPSERGSNNTRLRGRGSGNDGSGAIKRVRLVGSPLGCLELLLVLVLVLADGSVHRLPPAALKRVRRAGALYICRPVEVCLLLCKCHS
ncbi:hypothetical protein ACLKA7_015750 [Drosophila subpalustris]